MAILLNIETATSVCSVALAEDERLLAIRESFIKNSHAEFITVFVDEVIKEAGLKITSIDAVAVSKGPGSYTGLRIGVSTAKGLCYALEKPLLAINTLRSMADGAKNIIDHKKRFKKYILYPMIDARRMEVFSALYDQDLVEMRETNAEIINSNSLDAYKGQNIFYFGDGATKCYNVFEKLPGVELIADFTPSAGNMLQLSNEKYLKGDFENVAYFEPYYLKDFIAGKPKVKGLL